MAASVAAGTDRIRVMYAVIMAGGGGTRLWPLSRPETPKPFLYLPVRQTASNAQNFQIRTRLGPDTMSKVLTREVKALDANLAPGEVITVTVPAEAAKKKFKVRIDNPQGEKVFEKEVSSDEYGGLAGEFALPKSAALTAPSRFSTCTGISPSSTHHAASHNFTPAEHKKAAKIHMAHATGGGHPGGGRPTGD